MDVDMVLVWDVVVVVFGIMGSELVVYDGCFFWMVLFGGFIDVIKVLRSGELVLLCD